MVLQPLPVLPPTQPLSPLALWQLTAFSSASCHFAARWKVRSLLLPGRKVQFLFLVVVGENKTVKRGKL